MRVVPRTSQARLAEGRAIDQALRVLDAEPRSARETARRRINELADLLVQDDGLKLLE